MTHSGCCAGVDRREVLVPEAGGGAAVDDELRPGRVTGLVAGQVDHEIGDLFGFGGPAQRGLEDVFGNPLGHRRLDQAGMNRVHPDSARPQLQCCRLRQPADGEFGCGVTVAGDGAGHPLDRGDVDDRSSSRFLHGFHHGADAEKHSRQIDVEDPLPLRDRRNPRRCRC